MSTKDEQKSLNKNPLPPQAVSIAVLDYATNCPAERVLTNILLIDEQLERIQNAVQPHLTSLTMQRNALMNRARAENILSDDNGVLLGIEGKKIRNKITDNEAFELAFPEEVKMIREAQKMKIDDDHTLALKELPNSEIPLGLADEKVGKKAVTEFVGYQPTTITYVVRKRMKSE